MIAAAPSNGPASNLRSASSGTASAKASSAPMPQASTSPIAAATLTLLASRGESSSICPSEVARFVGDSLATRSDPTPSAVIAGAPLGLGVAWRELMPLVRRCATEMAEEGSVTVTQGHGANLRTVDLGSGKVVGPIRLRRGDKFQEAFKALKS